MGLDMYLTAKRYVWKARDDDHSLQDKLNEVMADELGDGMRVNEVSADAMYWRKANAIHKWFVENVQDGEDNCREYWVDSAQLEQLLKMCQLALEHKDKPDKILPTQDGFFFGSTEYEDWYWSDIEETIKGLEKVLKLDQGKWDFYYRSSW
jgi:hypothetical protein